MTTQTVNELRNLLLLAFLIGHFLYFLPVQGSPPFPACCPLLLLISPESAFLNDFVPNVPSNKCITVSIFFNTMYWKQYDLIEQLIVLNVLKLKFWYCANLTIQHIPEIYNVFLPLHEWFIGNIVCSTAECLDIKPFYNSVCWDVAAARDLIKPFDSMLTSYILYVVCGCLKLVRLERSGT